MPSKLLVGGVLALITMGFLIATFYFGFKAYSSAEPFREIWATFICGLGMYIFSKLGASVLEHAIPISKDQE